MGKKRKAVNNLVRQHNVSYGVGLPVERATGLILKELHLDCSSKLASLNHSCKVGVQVGLRILLPKRMVVRIR